MFRRKILQEESISTVRDNGLMTALILMLCIGKDFSMDFPEKKRILTLGIAGIGQMVNGLKMELRKEIVKLLRIIKEPTTKREKMIWRRREAYADFEVSKFRNRFENRVARMKGKPKLQTLLQGKMKKVIKNVTSKKA